MLATMGTNELALLPKCEQYAFNTSNKRRSCERSALPSHLLFSYLSSGLNIFLACRHFKQRHVMAIETVDKVYYSKVLGGSDHLLRE